MLKLPTCGQGLKHNKYKISILGPAFSLDVFAIDIYFNQGKLTGKPWDNAV